MIYKLHKEENIYLSLILLYINTNIYKFDHRLMFNL